MPHVIFPGPEGRLEGRFSPGQRSRAPVAMILHPHSQGGGTMNDRIVQMLPDARAGIGGNDSDLGLGERQRRFDLAALSRPPGRCEQIRDAPVASSHAGLSVQ